MLQKTSQQKQSTLLQSLKSNELISICNELNLNIQKLNIQEEMVNPTYRRLYNIVKNDMSRSVFQFRKNLIKELYFLLQIMPIIKPENKQTFIQEVQKLYNLNDHKKIELASNKMNKILKDVHSNNNSAREVLSGERPKSGVEWNQKISPFLRPYTAQRPQNKSSSKNKNYIRPQSSKFAKSTKHQTVAQTQDIYIRQFTTNIKEQLQISKDFVQGHRTLHPMQEPIYQQLYNILKKIETSPTQHHQEPKPAFQRTKNHKFRYAKSAITRKQTYNVPKTQPDQLQKHSQHQYQPKQCLQVSHQNFNQNNLQHDQSDKSSEQQYLYVNDDTKQKKAYVAGISLQEQQQQKIAMNQIERLDKYHHLIQNKLIQAIQEDNQMAVKYIDFAKNKSFMRKELNRKAQSKRLMSANNIKAKYIKLTKQSYQEDNGKQNVVEQRCKAKVFDFTGDYKLANKINHYPTYSRNNFFEKALKQDVKSFQKDKIFEKSQQKQKVNVVAGKPKIIRPMTAFVRYNQIQRFDPFSQQNIKKHNEQALEQIEKIKMKVGGKFSASTQSLMKVLYIDAHQKIDHLKWEQKNPCFGMISIGKKPKKLKKRGRKLTKQSTSQRK